jgi:hypothetical protein
MNLTRCGERKILSAEPTKEAAAILFHPLTLVRFGES